MGLDMYAHYLHDAPATAVDFEAQSDGELHYWWKHADLQGWMERLYREKGGREASFNRVNLVLTAEDLDQLEADIRAGKLPRTAGFASGECGGSGADDDLRFIEKAREAIAEGLTVYYWSWG